MPILKSPEPTTPLTQGDILQGLRLYTTSDNWTDAKEAGGSAAWLKETDLCMVISRPCVALHKSSFIVAAIDVVKEAPPEEVKAFNEVKAFLSQLRDGYRRPDRFYLGQIAGKPTGRYYALLDSLHTITKPPEADLQAYLKKNRPATLTDEFRHDLALRVFSAFANLGFDDYGWYSDQDLQWVLEVGQTESASKKSELSAKKAEVASLKASGAAKNQKHIDSLESAVANLEKESSALEAEMTNFRAETAKRSSG